MKSHVLVSVIVCSYNGKEFIKDCINSIKRTLYKSFEVIIIDDGSTDGSGNLIKDLTKHDQRFLLIHNQSNIGLTKSRNIGIKKARGEIIIFLDNDTEVTPNWMKSLVETILSSKDIGAAQSLLVDFKDRNKIQLAGIKLIPFVAWGAPIFNGEPVSSYKAQETIISLGAAMAVRKEVLLATGGFDELLVHYTDDLDMSWRIWLSGYRIMSCPKSIVYHWTKNSNYQRIKEGTRVNTYYHLCKNSFRSILKNYNPFNAFRYFLYSMLINYIRAILVLIKRRDSSALLGVLKASGWILVYLSSTLKERYKTQSFRKISDREIIKYAMLDKSPLDIYNHYFRQTQLL